MNSNGKRAQYNYGEAVTSEMFRVDQTYHIRQREAWNKALSGWGVIGDGFQLRYDSTLLKATVSGGVAIAADGQALWSDSAIESSQFNPAADDRFAIICIKRRSDGCDKVLSVDGENHVCTAWEDRTVVEINAVASESDIPDKVQQLADAGRIVVGILERVDGKWVASTKYRHQGPIDPPGGKDAARIANAISVTGAHASAASSRLRSLLFTLGVAATSALVLVALIWIGVWYCTYFVPPQVPYSVVIKEGKDLQGPIAGETYDDGEFTVVVRDQFGKPIEGIVVEYKLGTRNPAGGNAVPLPSGAVFADEISTTDSSDTVRLLTDSNGEASPGAIRFAGLPASDAVHGESVILTISFPESELAAIERQLTPVRRGCDQLMLVSNFLHAPDPIDGATPVVTAIREVHRVNEQFQLRVQALNGGFPISVNGLTAKCSLWTRTPQSEELPELGDPLPGPWPVPDTMFPSSTQKQLVPVRGESGENSWITFNVELREAGMYRARIEVELDGAKTSRDLYFLVVH